MKVLTIREPFATLIKDGVKCIETRSWNTHYRGKLYIHAGVAKINKSIYERVELVKLFEDKKMNYGNIICKCNLVDCVYMDENFIKEIKKNHKEYICGHYSVGRYAWLLSDIEIIDSIEVKGKLSIWNYEK